MRKGFTYFWMGSSWNYMCTYNCITLDRLWILILQQVKQYSKGKEFVQTLMWKENSIYVNKLVSPHHTFYAWYSLLGTSYPLGLSYSLRTWLSLFSFHPYDWESILSMMCGRARLSSTADLLTQVAQASPIHLGMRNEKRGRLKALTSSPGVNYNIYCCQSHRCLVYSILLRNRLNDCQPERVPPWQRVTKKFTLLLTHHFQKGQILADFCIDISKERNTGPAPLHFHSQPLLLFNSYTAEKDASQHCSSRLIAQT